MPFFIAIAALVILSTFYLLRQFWNHELAEHAALDEPLVHEERPSEALRAA